MTVKIKIGIRSLLTELARRCALCKSIWCPFKLSSESTWSVCASANTDHIPWYLHATRTARFGETSKDRIATTQNRTSHDTAQSTVTQAARRSLRAVNCETSKQGMWRNNTTPYNTPIRRKRQHSPNNANSICIIKYINNWKHQTNTND